MQSKTIIVVVPWNNTKNNHSGMYYFSKLLCSRLDSEMIIQNVPINNKLNKIYSIVVAIFISMKILYKCKPNDKVLLMEYLLPSVSQYIIAYVLKRFRSDIKIIGVVHLSPNHLGEKYGHNFTKLKKHLKYIDGVIVFGSTLQKFLSKYISEKKIYKILHYVEHSYYGRIPQTPKNDVLNVICQGNLKRDSKTLVKVIERFKDENGIHFNILSGVNRFDHLSSKNNLTVYPYLSEDELKAIMMNCHVSLNILEDTVGSNVITTSMAAGLAMIVTDVGSIRDYLDDESSLLCRDIEDYVNALIKLMNDRNALKIYQRSSYEKSFSIEKDKIINKYKDVIDSFN